MAWLRKPRLNKAVATVGVLMVLSLSRVATFRVDMAGPFRRSADGRFADGRNGHWVSSGDAHRAHRCCYGSGVSLRGGSEEMNHDGKTGPDDGGGARPHGLVFDGGGPAGR